MFGGVFDDRAAVRTLLAGSVALFASGLDPRVWSPQLSTVQAAVRAQPGLETTILVNGLIGAIVSYALALASTYVVAMVIDNLAPSNGGTRNMVQAFKVSAYSSTAQWIAGIFALIPALSPLSILGIYGLYLLYLGLPVLMKAPAAKATSYTITVVVAVIVVFIVIAIVTGLLFAGAVLAT